MAWLGNATVLTLTPDLLASCSSDPASLGNPQGQGGARSDAGNASQGGYSNGGDTTGSPAGGANSDDAAAASQDAAVSFPFAPSQADGSLYDNWFINTVDPQDITAILGSWTLSVDGLVNHPITMTFQDLLQLPRHNQVTDFHCVEGWSVFDVPWNGLHIDSLIGLVEPTSAATHLTFQCFGNIYQESLPLSLAQEPHTMLAYGIDGNTLPQTHGFPLRLVVPRLLGYKSAKWVQRITFTDAAAQGYWEQFGYSYDAEVPPARLRDGKY